LDSRSALRGMDPDEAFPRLERFVAIYLELRMVAISEGVTKTAFSLAGMRALLTSSDPGVVALVNEAKETIDWLRQWFPSSRGEDLLHLADLVCRALHVVTNQSAEEKFVNLVVAHIGLINARKILDRLEKRGFASLRKEQ
jgi:hypothetical protein